MINPTINLIRPSVVGEGFLTKEGRRFSKKVVAGIKEGSKEAVRSYVGNFKHENIGAKAASGVYQAGKSFKASKAVQKAAIKKAESRVAKLAIRRSTGKILAKAAIKGFFKGASNIIGLTPDIISFAKGFKRGFSAYGN